MLRWLRQLLPARRRAPSPILCDTSQDPQFSRLVRDWISRCDYPDVRHLQFAAGTKGLADLPRDQQVVAVNAAMCRIYNRLRENLTTD